MSRIDTAMSNYPSRLFIALFRRLSSVTEQLDMLYTVTVAIFSVILLLMWHWYMRR